jgi:hypothetical protein
VVPKAREPPREAAVQTRAVQLRAARVVPAEPAGQWRVKVVAAAWAAAGWEGAAARPALEVEPAAEAALAQEAVLAQGAAPEALAAVVVEGSMMRAAPT